MSMVFVVARGLQQFKRKGYFVNKVSINLVFGYFFLASPPLVRTFERFSFAFTPLVLLQTGGISLTLRDPVTNKQFQNISHLLSKDCFVIYNVLSTCVLLYLCLRHLTKGYCSYQWPRLHFRMASLVFTVLPFCSC